MLRTQHTSRFILDSLTCFAWVLRGFHLVLKEYPKAAADLPVNGVDPARVKIGLVNPMTGIPIFPVQLGQGQGHGLLHLEIE